MKRMMTLMVVAFMAILTNAQTTQKIYDEEINPNVQIEQAVAKAKASSKFVICQVGGNWCPWCLRFAAFIKAMI